MSARADQVAWMQLRRRTAWIQVTLRKRGELVMLTHFSVHEDPSRFLNEMYAKGFAIELVYIPPEVM